MTPRTLIITLWAAVPVAGCGASDPAPTDPGGDFEGIEEATGDLTDLSSQCTFVSGTGTLTVALATGDIAMIAKSSTSQMTINGYNCGGATSTTMKKLVVTGTTGAQTLILDFMGGTFGLGNATGVGIDIDLGAGTDPLKIRGSKAADTITFGSTGIAINTDTYKDIAIANVDSYTVSLSDGNDTFSGAGSAATGGAAFTADLVVYGGAGNDTLTGGDGDDTLNGGDGNDTFKASAAVDGADTLNGDAGTDTADYSARSGDLTITIDGTGNDGEASEADDVGTDIEIVKGGSGDDDLTGSAGDDTLYGGDGDDTLTGGAGNDVLYGDAGDDTFDEESAANGGDTFNGGAGTDTVTYTARSNAVIVTIDTTANDGESGELDKVLTDVENVIGGGGDDTITGSASANVLEGGAGADTLNGGLGNDTLRGGAGIDTLNGDAGDDTFDEESATNGADSMHGGTGVDTVTYTARTNDLVVVMDGATGSGEASEGDLIFTDVENLIGGGGDDDLTGNAADNLIEGGAGADALAGLAGDDVLDGNAGSDDLDCGAGEGDISLDTTTNSITGCEL